MKEKIIDFFNGIFVYDRPVLKTEPEELVLVLEPGETAEGSFVVSSCDERRIKGLLHTGIPGMTLKGDCFFARAARVEYSYRPRFLREGAVLEGRIWLETSAGEYELPVKVRIKGAAEEEEEDTELPVVLAKEEELPVYRTGSGQSEAWKSRRRQESALAEIQRVVERERRGVCEEQKATERLRELTDCLTEAEPESALYPLLNAWVMLREKRREEAGWILKKYEKTRLLPLRDASVRAVFLYVNGLFCEEEKTKNFMVSQLRKLHQKQPENQMITAFLLELDPQLRTNIRTRYLMLERQFYAGMRHRLLYQEAFSLLREDMALFTRLEPFSIQVFGWAAAHGLLTEEIAGAVALQATRIRKWSPLAAGLLRTCYEVCPSKETAGAVCLIYIRGHRTDEEAFTWYERGVEQDAKITNLYEYFIYALPEHYQKLFPKQIFLYFQYHNTLTGVQKTALYSNLVRYGKPGEEIYEDYRRQIQEFLLEQLKGRKVNDDLAWLYGRCLLAETLEEDLLEALADVLFLQKITCGEKRIRRVEVCHKQLKDAISVPVAGGVAYVPVYTKDAEICLVDEDGKRHWESVPYERKRVMIEPKFLELCTIRLQDHLGLNLYLLDGDGSHQLKRDNLSLAWKLLEDERVRESYGLQLRVELLEYGRRHGRPEQPDERLLLSDEEALKLPEDGQSVYIECLILAERDEEALRLLWKSGCRTVDPELLLRLWHRLVSEGRFSENLLQPLAHEVFEKGVYTEQVVEMLMKEHTGDTRSLLALWKAGKQFGMLMPELEERLLVQALFTEQYVCDVFPVFQSLDDRGGESVISIAYLNYVSWLDFVKGQEVPEELFDSLEHHLVWEDRLSAAAVLSWLRHLSLLLLLTETQKNLARKLLRDPGIKNRRFGFMQKLGPYMDDRDRPFDHVVVEHRCNPGHKVVLHYVLEYHGKKNFEYVTERLYPVCEGVFTRAFVLFYGERLTWFITETKEDGTETATECRTMENRDEHTEGNSRYSRLCRMQQALDHRQERTLKRLMAEYEELTELVEEKFSSR